MINQPTASGVSDGKCAGGVVPPFEGPCPRCGVMSDENCPFEAALSAKPAQGGDFQSRVQPWMMACFGPEISADKLERNDRFIEEALELCQASGYTKDRAHALVDYVFDRPQGEINQEVGGVMVTLAAHCLANDVDMHQAGETELARIWTKVDQIRAKQAAKPTGSALPVAKPAQMGGRVAVETTMADWSSDMDDAIYAAVGRHSDYSGCGASGRDHGWVCGSEIEAERVTRALKKMGLPTRVVPTEHPIINREARSGEDIPCNLPGLEKSAPPQPIPTPDEDGMLEISANVERDCKKQAAILVKYVVGGDQGSADFAFASDALGRAAGTIHYLLAVLSRARPEEDKS